MGSPQVTGHPRISDPSRSQWQPQPEPQPPEDDEDDEDEEPESFFAPSL